jgi:hypothetical protein
MDDYVDEKLAVAFHDVPLPVGLAQRLLDRLDAQQADERDFAPHFSFFFRNRSGVGGTRSFSRRWLLLAGGGLLATAACLLIAVWLAPQAEESLNEQFVLDEAIRSFAGAHQQTAHLLAEQAPPRGYPVSAAVRHVRGTRWRSVDDFVGSRAIVYDLPGRSGIHAALYVVDAAGLDGLAVAPSLHPFTTGGCCATAWQENGLLYVLVVQGDTAAYTGYLNLLREPVA